ncbi:hypothetical protein TeGR_g7768 [Tetraparma gracilis]|uniref:C2HC zinc finger plants domain-containing protein n=1 Tax=Tetraparma gracilis TaxID=2962635 RepID=A0ABQ6MII0_9STRA|nr:hypothetical protein TeGR_g7768 [Tetraparma gracilis]
MSFLCPACGDTVASSRRAQHEELWCSALGDSGEEQEHLEASSSGPGAAASRLLDLNTRARSVTSATLSSGLRLSFLEVSVFASGTATGGALWASSLLLAEWALRHAGGGGAVLELGCGACPAAGIAAASRGAPTVMTDRGGVVELAEANLRRNLAAVEAAAGGPLAREVFDTAVFEWGGEIPARVLALGPLDCVLVGDCIFSERTHALLLDALARLLLGGARRAVLAYQRRSQPLEAAFFRLAEERHGLRAELVTDAASLKALLGGRGEGLELVALRLK